MAKVFIEETSLTAIGDAIRAKTGGTEALSVPTGMVDAIASIETGGGGSDGNDIQAIEDGFLNRTYPVGDYVNDRIDNKIFPYQFSNNSKLTSVNLPNVIMIDEYAFSECSHLTEVIAPKVDTINTYAFTYSGITKAYFPLWNQITGYVFVGCQQLESVYLPKATWAYTSAFSNCPALTRVDLPALEYINTKTFYNCESLTTLILRNTSQVVTLAKTDAFSNTGIMKDTGYVYVPQALIEEYKTATNWSVIYSLHNNMFRAIEDYPEICEEVIP